MAVLEAIFDVEVSEVPEGYQGPSETVEVRRIPPVNICYPRAYQEIFVEDPASTFNYQA